jgi:hypothetical protein
MTKNIFRPLNKDVSKLEMFTLDKVKNMPIDKKRYCLNWIEDLKSLSLEDQNRELSTYTNVIKDYISKNK